MKCDILSLQLTNNGAIVSCSYSDARSHLPGSVHPIFFNQSYSSDLVCRFFVARRKS